MKTNNIIFLLSTFGLMFLTGCATSIVYEIKSEKIEPPVNFRIIDARDENQKKAEIGSLLITDCLYGLYKIGDNQTAPHRLKLLEEELYKSIGAELKGHTITINKYEIFNNYRSQFIGNEPPGQPRDYSTPMAYGLSANSLSGWLIAPIVTAIIRENMCEDKIFREKNPDNLPSIIVNIDITMSEMRVTGNMVQIEPIGKEATARGEFTLERIRRALISTNQKIAQELKKILQK